MRGTAVREGFPNHEGHIRHCPPYHPLLRPRLLFSVFTGWNDHAQGGHHIARSREVINENNITYNVRGGTVTVPSLYRDCTIAAHCTSTVPPTHPPL